MSFFTRIYIRNKDHISEFSDFQTVQLVNRELQLINTYFKVNKLLNVDKTVFMVFTSARTKYDANVIDNRILIMINPYNKMGLLQNFSECTSTNI